MVTNDDLRKYADTWISIVTVFLAVELAGLIFIYQLGHEGVIKGLPLALFGIGLIGTTGTSLISFLAVRDPRTNFDVAKGIDIGIGLIACNVIVVITGLYLNDLIFLKGNPVTATIMYTVELAGLITFYPVLYYKFFHKKHL